mmetsp:Transcript_95097/g.254107  ORF Transcript_95097/g.254107 Transcript_95097/m.254107 type:complete len:218 (-) Transcript_95097:22-675(-)
MGTLILTKVRDSLRANRQLRAVCHWRSTFSTFRSAPRCSALSALSCPCATIATSTSDPSRCVFWILDPKHIREMDRQSPKVHSSSCPIASTASKHACSYSTCGACASSSTARRCPTAGDAPAAAGPRRRLASGLCRADVTHTVASPGCMVSTCTSSPSSSFLGRGVWVLAAAASPPGRAAAPGWAPRDSPVIWSSSSSSSPMLVTRDSGWGLLPSSA